MRLVRQDGEFLGCWVLDYCWGIIHEPKRRLVSAAPFHERVVHHALCRVIEPIWEARFIHTSFACRVGKGTHAALDQCHA